MHLFQQFWYVSEWPVSGRRASPKGEARGASPRPAAAYDVGDIGFLLSHFGNLDRGEAPP